MKNCSTCDWWYRDRHPRTRYGYCSGVYDGIVKKRVRARPYWYDPKITGDAIKTVDVNGSNCEAWLPRRTR